MSDFLFPNWLSEYKAGVITALYWAHVFKPHLPKGREAFSPLPVEIKPECINLPQLCTNTLKICAFFTSQGKPTVNKYCTLFKECFQNTEKYTI